MPKSAERKARIFYARVDEFWRLGNRSALDWIIDQYQVSTDKRSGITSDANRQDDPQYIVRLIGQVVTISQETVKLVQLLSAEPLLEKA